MLFINLYNVIEAAGEFFDDVFVPGISGSPEPIGRIVRLGGALTHPYWAAMLDGRLFLWLALTLGAIHLAWRTSRRQSRSVASRILLLATIGVGTLVQWRLSDQGRYTSHWWPISDVEGIISHWLGPAACVCFVATMTTLRSLLQWPVDDRHLDLHLG